MNTMKLMKILLSFLLICLLQHSNLLAQCNGILEINSQEVLNKFGCKSWDGSILISGKDIIDLTPLQVLQQVSVDLVISKNDNLETLEGLNNLVSVNRNLIIENNPILVNFGKSPFSLEVIGNNFTITNCPNLSNQENFPMLARIINRFSVENVNSFNGFNNLEVCPWIGMIGLKQNSLEGFKSLRNSRILNIEAWSNLEKINAFGSLVAVEKDNSGEATFFQLKDNPKLKGLAGFTSLSSVTNLAITGNSNLADCCNLLPALLSATGTINISLNSSGCDNQKAINAQPSLNNCPSSESVVTSSTSCGVSYSLTQPIPSDNCDLAVSSFRLTLADGSIALSESISGGATNIYSLQTGSNIFRFEANDGAGNQTICTTTIIVSDGAQPALTNCPSDVTIGTNSNIQCSGGFTYTAPNASDNCSLVSFTEKIIAPGGSLVSNSNVNSGQNFSKTFSLGTSTVEYTANDKEGNASVCSFLVTVEDSKAPSLSGIPASVTISCDESFPAIPSPTASDICNGDLTSLISQTSSINEGSCAPGEIAEKQEYTWTVTDDTGNSTSAMWSVTIVSDFEFDLGDNLSLCGTSNVNINAGNIGASYLWSTGETTSSISVNSTGTYSLTVTSANGCCYSDAVEVTIGDNPTASALGGVLSCVAGSVQISGFSTTPGVTYSWSGPGGFTSAQQNPSVTGVGTYNLTVSTTNGCAETAQAEVTADTDVPNVSAIGGVLTCAVTEITLSASSSTAGVSYSWTGPSAFASSQQNPQVTLPGTYTVSVVGENGCSSSADAKVIADQTGPLLNLSAGMLSCKVIETQIAVIASSNLASLSWSGPNGFTSENQEPTIEEVGLYTVISTSENGCTSSHEIEITGDYAMPSASATGGMISCSDNETMISGSTTTPNATFSWTGPNDFTSTLQNPFISQPGTYLLTVMGENGCTATAEALVDGDGEIPNITASGGTIDCFNESVVIKGTVDDTSATTAWTGPNGFATTQLTADVDIPGTYIFTVTTPGGCQSFATVQVVLDNSEPTFSIGEGFIDCEGGVRDFILITSNDDVTYAWSGPNGFESTVKRPTYSEAGTYSVTITGNNGCVSSGSIVVDHDVPYSYEITTTDGVIKISIDGGTPPFSFLWNGKTEGESVTGLTLGENFIRITDGLGCEKIAFFDITSSVININSLDDVRIYPNPATNYIHLELDKDIKNSTLDILDQKGTLVSSHKGETELNVSNLASGVYFIRINTKKEVYFYKFLKL